MAYLFYLFLVCFVLLVNLAFVFLVFKFQSTRQQPQREVCAGSLL